MNNSFPKKQVSKKKINQSQGSQQDVQNSTIDNLKQPKMLENYTQQRRKQQKWSLKAKATIWSVTISMLPVLVVGSATYYIGNELITKQITPEKPVDGTDVTETQLALDRYLLFLVMGTGVTAVLGSAIAAILANRAIAPILNAAEVSISIVRRLNRQGINTSISTTSKDELVTLETNLSVIKQQLPDLLWKREVEAERIQVLHKITRRIQESLNAEDVLNTTVEEVRTAFQADRVTIFRFNTYKDGIFVAESVASDLPKTLWATLSDPCFEKDYLEQYQNGRVRAIDNIYEANLGDCHIGLLERFAVKANLVAPIFQNKQLFGLLIAHQCFKPRNWQQSDVNLFAQIASQVGFALNYTRLLEQVDTKADQTQVFVDITRRIRESLNEEDVLKATVEEVRKAISTDRVIVYGFDADWYGTVIAESVLPGFPKALRANIKDPCFAEGYVEQYQAGRVQAINNIYEAGLTQCHISQLEPFAVKANLVAPILKDDQLFGLLIAHQCSGSRKWRKYEIDFFAQIAMEVGFALDHARLLQRIEAEVVRTQLLGDLTQDIRQSLHEEDVLKATVEEVRKAMSADRVIVYGFDADWYGTVIAESVLPRFPKALRANIKDPCFAEGYVEKYQAGRVQAINNIYEAGLTQCHISQLEPFAVKANLVAPILKDKQLFGLLIAHQCSAPRDWRESEIDLFTQIAMQVGFALDHARLLNQVEQAYQAAAASSVQHLQKQEEIQRQVSEMLKNSNTVIQTLSQDVALKQMQSIKSIYHQIEMLGDSAQEIVTSAQQVELQQQQLSQKVEDENQSMNQILNSICAIQETVVQSAEKINCLEQPSQKLYERLNLISSVVSKMKLQAMHTALEASRSGEAGQKFAAIAQKALSLVQQLDSDITEIQPLVAEIHTQSHEVKVAIESGVEQATSSTELIAETQQKFAQAIALSIQMQTLVKEIAQAATFQAQASSSANQSILGVASIASQTSEQALAVAESLAQLATFAQDL